jgi:hypothetical protein
MEQLFERIIELLGKPIDHSDVLRFVRELGERPTPGIPFVFEKSGFILVPAKGILVGVLFCMENSSKGFTAGFKGNLPGGIKRGDSRTTVRKVLILKPTVQARIDNRTGSVISSDDIFELENCRLQVGFDDEGRLTGLSATSPDTDLSIYDEREPSVLKRFRPKRRRREQH